jgi:hypothetical protein
LQKLPLKASEMFEIGQVHLGKRMGARLGR